MKLFVNYQLVHQLLTHVWLHRERRHPKYLLARRIFVWALFLELEDVLFLYLTVMSLHLRQFPDSIHLFHFPIEFRYLIHFREVSLPYYGLIYSKVCSDPSHSSWTAVTLDSQAVSVTCLLLPQQILLINCPAKVVDACALHGKLLLHLARALVMVAYSAQKYKFHRGYFDC